MKSPFRIFPKEHCVIRIQENNVILIPDSEIQNIPECSVSLLSSVSLSLFRVQKGFKERKKKIVETDPLICYIKSYKYIPITQPSLTNSLVVQKCSHLLLLWFRTPPKLIVWGQYYQDSASRDQCVMYEWPGLTLPLIRESVMWEVHHSVYQSNK